MEFEQSETFSETNDNVRFLKYNCFRFEIFPFYLP